MTTAEPKRVAFFLWNVWFFRNFSGVIGDLAKRGHEVTIVLQRSAMEPSALRTLDQLTARWPTVKACVLPERSGAFGLLAKVLARAIDYLYFQRPVFAEAPILRIRMEHRTHSAVRALAGPFAVSALREPALRALIALERALPRSAAIVNAIRELRPDVAVFSPLIDVGTDQFEHLRCTRRIGIPSVFAVHSWDNLSTKSLLREPTDEVAVWNFRQVEEALAFHDVPRERVTVTGAPTYDRCFAYRPAENRDAFLTRLGLGPGRPTLLYVGSATPTYCEKPEAEFTRRWIEAVRAAEDPRLASANIIMRPHPKRALDWTNLQPGPGVVVFPRSGENPVDDDAFESYALSLFHADCVVGINTSAMIEAGIFGKPVLTVLDPAHAGSQTGTFHFRYLLEQDGQPGLLRAAASLPEHVAQLADALDRSPADAAAARAFVTTFVRPLGPDMPATAIFADFIERVGTEPVGARSPRIASALGAHAGRSFQAACSAVNGVARAALDPARSSRK